MKIASPQPVYHRVTRAPRWTCGPRGSARKSCSGDPASENAGDVVGTTVFVRLLNQTARRRSQIGGSIYDGKNLFVVHRTGEPIRAEQDDVVGSWNFEAGIDLDGVFHAERANDHVFVREIRNLLRRQPLHLDVVVEQGVVFGQLLELSVANAVDAAVAHVSDIDAIDDSENRNDGRSHSALAGIALRRFGDTPVFPLDAGDEAVFPATPCMGPVY